MRPVIGTAQEAREGWWCPHARVALDGGGSANRGEAVVAHARCRATACAAWRWLGYRDGPALILHSIGDAVRHNPYMPKAAERVGYCGLAGKP